MLFARWPRLPFKPLLPSAVVQCVFIFSTMGISPPVGVVSLRETAVKIFPSDIHWKKEVSGVVEVETGNIHDKKSVDAHNIKQGSTLTSQIVWKVSAFLFFFPHSTMVVCTSVKRKGESAFVGFLCAHGHTHSKHNGLYNDT